MLIQLSVDHESVVTTSVIRVKAAEVATMMTFREVLILYTFDNCQYYEGQN